MLQTVIVNQQIKLIAVDMLMLFNLRLKVNIPPQVRNVHPNLREKSLCEEHFHIAVEYKINVWFYFLGV